MSESSTILQQWYQPGHVGYKVHVLQPQKIRHEGACLPVYLPQPVPLTIGRQAGQSTEVDGSQALLVPMHLIGDIDPLLAICVDGNVEQYSRDAGRVLSLYIVYNEGPGYMAPLSSFLRYEGLESGSWGCNEFLL